MIEFLLGLIIGFTAPYVIRHREEIIVYLKLRRTTK